MEVLKAIELVPTLLAIIYLAGSLNHYMLTRVILMLSKAPFSDRYIKFQSVFWPYYVLMMLLDLFFGEDEPTDGDSQS
jgi:hypothetical protein